MNEQAIQMLGQICSDVRVLRAAALVSLGLVLLLVVWITISASSAQKQQQEWRHP